jgi:hypothetical protein
MTVCIVCSLRKGAWRAPSVNGSTLFGSSAGFWLNLQQAYDLWHAMHAPGVEELDKIELLARA